MNEPTIIAPVQVPNDLTNRIDRFAQFAATNQIKTQTDLETTVNIRNQIVETIKQADGLFEGDDKPKTLAYRAWKSICDLHNQLVRRPKDALDKLNAQIKQYHLEQEKIRVEAQRELQRKLDEQAERERAALQAKAAKAKKPETQQKYLEQAAQVAAPQVNIPEAPKVQGISFRKTWKAEIVDDAALFEFICANKRRDLIESFNLKMLNTLAASLREQAKVPGVRFYEDAEPFKTKS